MLKRGIKIKVSFVFLAWLMIFAHGIIPHNHIDADLDIHAGYVHAPHDHDNHDDECSGNPEFRTSCEDHGTCVISNLLFQKFSTDEYFIHIENRTYISPLNTARLILFKYYEQLPAEFFHNSTQLRAPPAA